tara:strand:- start:852 stop:1643 length:792 start_codon:yes stop_codon:yes gene_type:complete
MSLEKNIRTIMESIGGSGNFPTGGFKLDPATGFAKKRNEPSVKVPTPASAGDIKPAGFKTQSILGRNVEIPYFDNYMSPETSPAEGKGYFQMVRDFLGNVTNAVISGFGTPEEVGIKPGMSEEEIMALIAAHDKKKKEKEEKDLEARGYTPLESTRHDHIKSTITESFGGILRGLGFQVGSLAAYDYLSNLLGASPDEMNALLGVERTVTTPRGPEAALAKTRKLKGVPGGELAQEGPRSKTIKKKVKGTLETRRSKERATRK